MDNTQRMTKRRPADERRFAAVLADSLELLTGEAIPYAVIGGLAVASYARPRYTHDIDVFLRPRDAVRALEVLAEAGFATEQTDPAWLFKAIRDEVTVDLIFRSSGDLYYDQDVHDRARERELLGVTMRVISPEDLLIIKAAAHIEDSNYHWFDALALLSVADFDWAYLTWRARRRIRRVLSLLVYADSVDIDIPTEVIRTLAAEVYDEESAVRLRRGNRAPLPRIEAAAATGNGGPDGDGDAEARQACEELRAAFREDPRTDDLDITVSVEGGAVVLTGDVATEERRQAIDGVASALLPHRRIDNRTRVRQADHEPAVERLA